METLDGTEWDVIIAGTGFVPSLLALSLSRSSKRILHIDQNEYYGGAEAAFSLSEAEAWSERFSSPDDRSIFTNASVSKPQDDAADDGGNKLSSSRAYSLALASHLLYSRSSLVPALISSRTHNQLDFQAVGSWFVVDTAHGSQSQATLTKVPSGREDVFRDKTFDLKATRSLMRFLRFVGAYEEQTETWEAERDTPFPQFLEQKFGLPPASHGPILALTMSGSAPSATTTALALPKIARHLRSIGVFGPGFGAVLPKWGGLAEIAQVACRACAVGGGVYVLNKGIKSVQKTTDGSVLSLELSDGEKVTTTWLAGCADDLPASILPDDKSSAAVTSRSISVVSSALTQLFPSTSEGGVTPAGAVVAVQPSSADEPPVFIFAHNSDAGECPMQQCILYASTSAPREPGFVRLREAVTTLLGSVDERTTPRVLWSMQYQQRSSTSGLDPADVHAGIAILPQISQTLVLEDQLLESVKAAWRRITGESHEQFMNFEAREGMGDDEDVN